MASHVPLTDRSGPPYTPREVMELLHLKDYQTLARWRMVGQGPRFVRLGRKHARLLYPREEFWAWIKERTFESEDQAAAAGCR